MEETLPAILERISHQVNVRFRHEGGTIIVSPDIPFMKTYRVNYVNVARNISSTVRERGGGQRDTDRRRQRGGRQLVQHSRRRIADDGHQPTSNDFWEQLRDNIRAILISTGKLAASADERARIAEENRAAREEALKRAEAVSRAGPGAAELMRNAFPLSFRTGSLFSRATPERTLSSIR